MKHNIGFDDEDIQAIVFLCDVALKNEVSGGIRIQGVVQRILALLPEIKPEKPEETKTD